MCNALIFTKKIKKYQTWGILCLFYCLFNVYCLSIGTVEN